MRCSAGIDRWLGAVAFVALLSGCGTSVSPQSAAANAAARGEAPTAANAKHDQGLYVTEMNGGRVYGFPIDNRRNKPPICALSGVHPNDVAVDGHGNLIVPSSNAYSGSVTIFKGPEMCGKKVGSVSDPFGEPTDAAASDDATTGTFIVGSLVGPGGDNPGTVAVCTLKAGCTMSLRDGTAQTVGGVALAKNGDCWVSAETVGYKAILIYHHGCAESGVRARGFANRYFGGLDIDDAGHLVAISSGDAKLYVYDGCNPRCKLVGGPFALKGSPFFGHLSASSTRLAVGRGSPSGVDVYAYAPTRVRFLYGFSKGLEPRSTAAATYNPRSNE